MVFLEAIRAVDSALQSTATIYNDLLGNGYKLYLIIAGEEIDLPVLPEKLGVKCKGRNSTTEVIGLGEINIVKTQGLRELQIQSFIPYRNKPYRVQPTIAPIVFVRTIEEARTKRLLVRLRLVGVDLNLNFPCAIENFEYEERAGETGDIYYTLDLKEYVDYAPKKITIREDGTGVVEENRQ